jgi:tetratricopeptide (TPR) repeat protein
MRRSSSTTLATCLFAALLPAAAHGDPTLASLWNHNGSVMALYVAGDEHEMRYQEPRIGMRQEGVMPGTVRFKGTLSGNTYAGTAFVFSRRCGTHLYRVTGTLAADGSAITLKGAAPAGFDPACKLLVTRNDVVQFNFLHAVEPTAPGATAAMQRDHASGEAAAATSERAGTEEARVAQEREAQRQRELQEAQARKLRERQELEQAEQARREQEEARLAEERRLAEMHRFADQRGACAKYDIAACDAALSSPHAGPQDIGDMRNWRGITEKLHADMDRCRGGGVAPCNEALSSPALSTEQRALIVAWRNAASPVNRGLAFVSRLVNAVADSASAVGNWPDAGRIAGGIAIAFGLTLAVTTLRRRDLRAGAAPPALATPQQYAAAAESDAGTARHLRHPPDTAGAVEALGIAHAYIEAVREAETPAAKDDAVRKQQIDMLAFASRQIDKAEKHDPRAVLEGEDRLGSYRFNACELRSEAHLLEGITLHPNDAVHAIRSLRKATALNPQNAYAYYVLGVMHATARRNRKAAAALERAVALQPQTKMYRKELDRVLGLQPASAAAQKTARGIQRIRIAGARSARAARRFARRRFQALDGHSRHPTKIEGQGEVGVHAAAIDAGLGRRAAR